MRITKMSEIRDFCTIEFDGKKYKINKNKVQYLISKLEEKTTRKLSIKEIKDYLKKYSMYDDFVLKQLN